MDPEDVVLIMTGVDAAQRVLSSRGQGSFLPMLLHPPRSKAISERDVIFNALRTASLAKITGSAVLEHAKKAAMTKLVQPGAEVVEEQ